MLDDSHREYVIPGFLPSVAVRKNKTELSAPPWVDLSFYAMGDVAKFGLNVTLPCTLETWNT